MAEDAPVRDVQRDEVIGEAPKDAPGRGTYRDGDHIRALFDGHLDRDEDGRLTVSRPRRPLPRARSARTTTSEEEQRTTVGGRGQARGGRHGAGKHGKPGGRPKKGFGDQGAWS